MLIKSKEEIAQLAHDSAKKVIQLHAAHTHNMNPNSMMSQLTDLIALAVQAGIVEVLKNTYTNEEFEQDLGLKP